MSNIHKKCRTRRTCAAAVLAFAAIVMGATMSAEARSITGVELVSSAGEMSLNVTFEAGEPGDSHALYIAYDTEDKGDTLASWAALQRGCNVAADATAATIPVSPLLTGEGYKVCRVFLTTSSAPYDTQLEYLRQSGTQYIDTGICPDATSVAVMDTKFDSNATKQQRFFAISSNTYKSGKKTYDDNSAGFSFDCYINGDGNFATACKDGKGDWKAAGPFTTDRVRISLSAAEKHHVTITNLASMAEIANATYNTTCTATSIVSVLVFAQHFVYKSDVSIPADKIAQGANLYSFSITTNSILACDYKPCRLGNRVGVYDTVTGNIIYSSSDTDFDAVNSGSPVACSLLAGETQLAAAPSATGLFFDYTWRGTAENWGDTDAWTKEGEPATWDEGNNAIFATANATATLAADVTANLLTFSADATVAGSATLTVPTVSVAEDASAVISAPIASAFEKTGAGTLTLTQNRTAATTVTEGTLKMDNATVADLTLGTYGGAPVTFDYGGQELVKNAHGLDYLVTGSTVMLTNGIFSTASGYDLNIRDDTFTMPSVLTIAKDAVVRQGAPGKSIYINNVSVEARTINVIGGMLGNTSGCSSAYLQHKSPAGRLNINVAEGGILHLPCTVYVLCGNNTTRTTPSIYMTFADSMFSAGTLNFGTTYSGNDYVPTNPTAVFAATNSVVSIDNGFYIGRNGTALEGKTDGSYTIDFEGSTVTAKTFAVYYDRPLNNARFNGTRFVFGADSGSIAASDGEDNWFTVGADGMTIDTQDYSATLNANLGGTGAVTKTGEGTLVIARNQTATAALVVGDGTLSMNSGVSIARAVSVADGATLTVNTTAGVGSLSLAAGSTLNIASYDGTTPLAVQDSATLPESGTVNLTLNGGAFGEGVYAIYSAQGVTAADGGKFTFDTTDNQTATWSVADGTLLLTVGDISGNYWTGRGGDGKMSTAANWLNGVPAAGADIDFSQVASAITIDADTGRAFGAATMGSGMITFTNALTVTSFTDPLKVTVGEGSTITIDNDVTLDDTPQRLCYTILTGGTLHITGSVEIESSSIIYVLYSATSGGTIIVDGGIAVSGNGTVWWNARVLALGENGISFTDNAPFLFIVDDAEVYALGERTVLGTEGRGRFRSKHDDVFLCTTQYKSDRPSTITFDGNFNGANDDCWGHWRATGCGKVVCTSAVKSNRGLRVYDGATLAFNPNTDTIGLSGQTFYVYNKVSGTAGGTLEVASSGTVKLTGNLSLADGTALAFNFTDQSTPPQLALSSGTLTASGAVTVKIPADCVRPKGGEYILTTCGGFDAEGVTVSLAEGAPKWVNGLSVNTDGNIVIDVKPIGTMIIFR